jgi:hypothetical protein
VADWLVPKVEEDHVFIANILYLISIPYKKVSSSGIIRQIKLVLGLPIDDQISYRDKCYVCGREFNEVQMHASCNSCGAGLCFDHLPLLRNRKCPSCKNDFGD